MSHAREYPGQVHDGVERTFGPVMLKQRIDPRRVNGAVFLVSTDRHQEPRRARNRIGFAMRLTLLLCLAETDFMQANRPPSDALHE